MTSAFRQRLTAIKQRHDEITTELSGDAIIPSSRYQELMQEYSSLDDIVININQLETYEKELNELSEAIANDDDDEFRKIAEEEKLRLNEAITEEMQKIKRLLIPEDKDDKKGAILEIRAGTGGEEAGLFASDLYRMYEQYANMKKWKFEVLEFSEDGIGAIKQAVVSISGKCVFSRLKYESGVHRVQRVPKTESSGRIHTSAATVAVLPEVEDVDIHIDERDLKIDTYRASGAGGQHVNKTDSAVRITHIPTGTVVAVQDERSQYRNKDKAMKILRAKIYEARKQAEDVARSQNRKMQVGSGDRSERIRTYNYPQGRVTDHRINLTLHKLDDVLNGIALDEIIDKLHEQKNMDLIMTSEII